MSALAVMFIVLALWEERSPLRRAARSLRRRWLNNFGLWAVSMLVAYAVLPFYGVGLALLVQDHGWGLFHLVGLPLWFETVAAIVLLDLVLWTQHLVLHKVPWLWRLHSVHHNDHDFDITTGLRFHPLEVLYTTGCIGAGIAVLGASPLAAFLYLFGLTLIEFFAHANIVLPRAFERRMRLVFVTPDYHRIHHSAEMDEQQSNFSAGLFPVWDRIFGTYRSQPKDGQVAMKVGLPEFAADRFERVPWMLAQPFVRAEPGQGDSVDKAAP